MLKGPAGAPPGGHSALVPVQEQTAPSHLGSALCPGCCVLTNWSWHPEEGSVQGCQEQFLMLGRASMQLLDGGCRSGPHKGVQPGQDFVHVSAWKFPEQVPV